MFLVLTPQQVIDAGRQIGTADNQIILGILLVVLILCVLLLGGVIAWLHKDNKRTITEFIAAIDKKEAAMTDERKARIDALMDLVKEDTAVKRDLYHALEGLKDLIQAKL